MTQVGLAGERWLRNFERRVVGGRFILQQSEDFFFDGELARVGELEAIAGEDLDSVIGPGIVRCRDDHAGRHGPRTREISHAGRGDHTSAVNIHAYGRQAFGDAVRNPGTRFTRVLTDDDLSLRAGPNEIMAEGTAD